MKLIPEARQASKLWSVRLAGLTAVLALLEAVGDMLPLWQGIVPDGHLAVAAAITGSATMLARVVKQDLPHE
jgi:hypothetical protein